MASPKITPQSLFERDGVEAVLLTDSAGNITTTISTSEVEGHALRIMLAEKPSESIRVEIDDEVVIGRHSGGVVAIVTIQRGHAVSKGIQRALRSLVGDSVR